MWHNEQQAQALLICRDQAMLTLTLPALVPGNPATGPKGASGEIIALALAENLDASTAQRRQQWLKN